MEERRRGIGLLLETWEFTVRLSAVLSESMRSEQGNCPGRESMYIDGFFAETKVLA